VLIDAGNALYWSVLRLISAQCPATSSWRRYASPNSQSQ